MGGGWGASGQDERLLQGANDGAGLAKCCSWGECDLACFCRIGAQALSPWQSKQSSQVTSLMLSLGLLSSPQLFPCLPASCVSASRLQVPLEDGGSASVLELGDGRVRWLERSEGGPGFSVGTRGWLPAQTSMQEGGQEPAHGEGSAEHAPAMGTVGPWTQPALHVGLCSRQRGRGTRPEGGAERESQVAAWSPTGKGSRVGSRSGRCWARVKVGLWFMGPRDERGLRRRDLGGEGLCETPERRWWESPPEGQGLHWRAVVGQERVGSCQPGPGLSCHYLSVPFRQVCHAA